MEIRLHQPFLLTRGDTSSNRVAVLGDLWCGGLDLFCFFGGGGGSFLELDTFKLYYWRTDGFESGAYLSSCFLGGVWKTEMFFESSSFASISLLTQWCNLYLFMFVCWFQCSRRSCYQCQRCVFLFLFLLGSCYIVKAWVVFGQPSKTNSFHIIGFLRWGGDCLNLP